MEFMGTILAQYFLIIVSAPVQTGSSTMLKKICQALLVVLLTSCSSSNRERDPICNCYYLFAQEVVQSRLDFQSSEIQKALMNVYLRLEAGNPEFKPCTDDSILDGDLFSRSKLRLYGTMNSDCVDNKLLQRIADHGPVIYKVY